MARWAISILISISAIALDATVHAQDNRSPGTVNIPKGVTLIVVNKSGEQITIQPPKTSVQLPVGTYWIKTWITERTDEEGNTWKLTGQYFGENETLNIIEGREITLSIGEPIIPSLSIKESNARYSFDHYLRGQRSEIVEITKNGGRPDVPKLHITNADGSYRETLTFAYG